MLSITHLLNESQYRLLDLKDQLLGQRDPLIPPRKLMYDGPRDPEIFKQNGAEFFRYYRELCQLQPTESILDVGCGVGRKTRPLVTYLASAARYEGLEINKEGVAWCQETIGRQYPHFHFQWINVYNQRYNPEGTVTATDYRFPFEDNQFDFVVLGSVFTHMRPPEVANYLSEISRVLKPETGRCLISYFLLNATVNDLIKSGKSSRHFAHDLGGFWVDDLALPENAIAFLEDDVQSWYQANGLTIAEPIQYGSWSGQEPHLSYQDLVLAYKT